ncbi:hypothetical protein CMI37_16270 [Candidatus Pacearchaeota archaeon]|nr:hypothetical protein [Candidatus Pacearchaeota archaeon]|tara:strand:+ start:3299 stop:3778 length:480 start_codon:yes stop_codon:yes gene_type:complete
MTELIIRSSEEALKFVRNGFLFAGDVVLECDLEFEHVVVCCESIRGVGIPRWIKVEALIVTTGDVSVNRIAATKDIIAGDIFAKDITARNVSAGRIRVVDSLVAAHVMVRGNILVGGGVRAADIVVGGNIVVKGKVTTTKEILARGNIDVGGISYQDEV